MNYNLLASLTSYTTSSLIKKITLVRLDLNKRNNIYFIGTSITTYIDLTNQSINNISTKLAIVTKGIINISSILISVISSRRISIIINRIRINAIKICIPFYNIRLNIYYIIGPTTKIGQRNSRSSIVRNNYIIISKVLKSSRYIPSKRQRTTNTTIYIISRRNRKRSATKKIYSTS